MRIINDKVENDGATADGKYPAIEFNSIKNEVTNGVTRSGQTLNSTIDTQLAESLFLHGVKSSAFQASGGANAIILVPISGANGVRIPADYTNMGGSRAFFRPSANNTGDVTVNIGQTAGTLLGVQSLRMQDGSEVPAGTISSDRIVEIQYDATNNYWIVLPWSLAAAQITLPLSINNGGTGATDAAGARTNLAVPPNTRNISTSGLANGGGNLASDRVIDVPISTQAQAEAGTDNTTGMTPLRVAQAIALLGGGLRGIETITTLGTSTYTRPSNVTRLIIFCTGGGGGGGFANDTLGGDNLLSGGGGGAGGTSIAFHEFTAGQTQLTVNVGGGGAAGTSTNGGAGSTSSVSGAGISITALGGGGGVGTSGASGTDADRVMRGGAGGAGTGAIVANGGGGGAGSVWARIGSSITTLNANQAQGGAGGSSFWSGGGIGASRHVNGITADNQNAVAGTVGAGGGGGAFGAFGTNGTAAAGGNGIVVIYEFG